jgi:hypothetical protein
MITILTIYMKGIEVNSEDDCIQSICLAEIRYKDIPEL